MSKRISLTRSEAVRKKLARKASLRRAGDSVCRVPIKDIRTVISVYSHLDTWKRACMESFRRENKQRAHAHKWKAAARRYRRLYHKSLLEEIRVIKIGFSCIALLFIVLVAIPWVFYP